MSWKSSSLSSPSFALAEAVGLTGAVGWRGPVALELAGGAVPLQPPVAQVGAEPVQRLCAPAKFKTPAGKR